ncbi:MAG: efflux RND transporter periplasmic adaptor subunit [Armatimonadetes bacterium]|nr:efflux RND transporter periplasmic adaptor subunit [Armatimonadota bacterium]
MHVRRRLVRFALFAACAALIAQAASASVTGRIGPYTIALTTDPAVIPVGKARVMLRVTDGKGAPVRGARVRALVSMPGMVMGEQETTAAAEPDKPGVYATDASFMMAGAYEAKLNVSGSAGVGTGTIPLQTGQDTSGAEGGASALLRLAPWLVGLLGVGFVLYRMRRTGQSLSLRAAADPSVLGALLMLAAGLAGSIYAVGHLRRPGAMTPIEAQAMEMNTPAPPGAAPVTLARAEPGPVRPTARYTGQVVGFNEQAVSARVQGWLVWMPHYVGDRVRAGQVIGRLDTSRADPQVAERRAAADMAGQGVGVARREHAQALAEAERARAELAARRDALAAAGAEAQSAREEQADAQAVVQSMQTQVATAMAQLAADEADQQYWRQEIVRERELLRKGAVSAEELQREEAQASASDARARQAQAGLEQARAQVRSAEAKARKADQGIVVADKRVLQMGSDVRAAEAAVQAARAGAQAFEQKVSQARSGVRQAAAGLNAAATERGYAEVRSQIDGIVTQRLAGPGTLVAPGQAVLNVAQIQPIRLQANVPQGDLARVLPGAAARVSRLDGSGDAVTARVTSIAPSVDPVARTGVVEALLPNADGRFLPGQFVALELALGSPRRALRLPSAAIRTRPRPAQGTDPAGEACSVWVAEPDPARTGRYTVQPVEVRTGAVDNIYTEVVSGLRAGQLVVLGGADDLRPGAAVMADAPATAMATANTATVEVSSKGYTPSEVTLRAGAPATLTFLRIDERNCGGELLMPDYGIRKALPLNKPITVRFTPRKGRFEFTCGMKMVRGSVVAR